MSEDDDLVHRLRGHAMCYENEGCYLLPMAAEEIEKLRSIIADLERALEAPCPHCGEKP